MRPSVGIASAYAAERRAFGRSIAEFPLVGAMLARMAVATYVVESVVYRIAGLIDARLAGTDSAGPDEVRVALEELAVECSIAKVLASEALDGVVDELVQIHGGYGYIEDYPAARAYRDSRINRIWEGTNEINRLLIPGTLLKRAMQGRIDLLGPARRAQEALLAGPIVAEEVGGEGPLAAESALVGGLRQLTLLLAGAAVQRYGPDLEEQQEVLAGLADLAIEVFALESTIVRAEQSVQDAPERSSIHLDLARAAVASRIGAAELVARGLAPAVAEGDDTRMLIGATRRLLRGDPVHGIGLSRQVAAHVMAAHGQPV
jgi:butyryl-CoA dehydrogenase